MKEMFDKELLEQYLSKHQIPKMFSDPHLPFRLFQYEPGEVINILHSPEEYLIFIVDGKYRVSQTLPTENFPREIVYEGLHVMGDLHFSTNCGNIFFHDVITPLHTVELYLPPLLEKLSNDPRFLRCMIHRLGQKIIVMAPHMLDYTLEDILLHHMRYECKDHQITNVGNTAHRLHHSRAQLQRVLKKLTEQGILVRKEKGVYALTDLSERRLLL